MWIPAFAGMTPFRSISLPACEPDPPVFLRMTLLKTLLGIMKPLRVTGKMPVPRKMTGAQAGACAPGFGSWMLRRHP